MIKDQITETKARTKRLQDYLYAVLLDYMVSEVKTKDDIVTFNTSNISVIEKLDKAVSKALSKQLLSLKKYILKGVSSILKNVVNDYTPIDTRAIQIGEEVQKRVTKHAIRNIEQITDLTPIYEQLKKDAVALMSKYEGVSLNELRGRLKDRLIKNKAIEKYWSRWTYDIYNQYERVGANEIRKELRLKFAMYEGGEIETTREFCEERNGHIFHESEILGWANIDWEGKNETGYNPLIDLGGYNCRHRLRWVSKEFAALKRPEVKTLFAFEFN